MKRVVILYLLILSACVNGQIDSIESRMTGRTVRGILNEVINTIASDSSFYKVKEGEILNDAITNAGTVNNIIIDKAVVLSADLSTSKNLIVYPGGMIRGDYTLTHTGNIYAGFYQIYDTTLTVAGSVANKRIIVDWWGVDKTGVDDSFYAFNEAFKRLNLENGYFLTMSKGNYRFLTGVTQHSYHMKGDIVIDFNNSTLDAEGGAYVVFGNISAGYGYETNPFAEDFVQGQTYVVVNDDNWADSIAGWWRDPRHRISINSTKVLNTSSSGTVYYDPMTISVDSIGESGGENRLYFKYPCPRDFDVDNVTYPLREQYGNNLVRWFATQSNVTIKNGIIRNLQTYVGCLTELKIDNMSFEVDNEYIPDVNFGLLLFNCDNVDVTDFKATNIRVTGFGYGLDVTACSRVTITGARFIDNRHCVSVTGGPEELGFDFSINNVDMISTGSANANNNIDAHGNQIGFKTDNIRVRGGWRVYSNRSGGGIIRNIYANDLTAAPFEFTAGGVVDSTICGVDNAYLQNCLDANDSTAVAITYFNAQSAFFSNIVSDSSYYLLRVDSCAVGSVFIDNSYIRGVPITSDHVTYYRGATIDSLYINGVKQ